MMDQNSPMTPRQREKLDKLGIDYDGTETINDAAEMLRSAMQDMVYVAPRLNLPETAFAIEAEGDPSNCRQWEV